MRQLLLSLLFLLLFVGTSVAQWYPWNYQTSSNCSTLVTGKFTDLCYQADQTLWKCVPSGGADTTCDSAGEWKQAGGGDESDPIWTSDKIGYYTKLEVDAFNYLASETDPIFSAWDKDYADLINKPTLLTTNSTANSVPVSIGTTFVDSAIYVVGSNVGIGSTSPDSRFVVSGAGTNTFSGNVGIGTTDVSGGALIVLNGNVGIGTTIPTQAFEVVGNIKANQIYNSALTAGRITYASTNGLLTDTSDVVVNALGNVGIGTTAPTAKLQVVGAVYLGGNVGIGTTVTPHKLSVDGSIYQVAPDCTQLCRINGVLGCRDTGSCVAN